MKNKRITACIITILTIACICSSVQARPGDCGFEGGISSGYAEGQQTFEYGEVCFLTGKPIELKGTLTIKKSLRQGVIRSTYTYNLANGQENATLRRVFTYDTTVTQTGSRQTLEETVFSRNPSEIVEVDGRSYVLTGFDFSRSNIIDQRPAVNFYAGNVHGRKTYSVAGAGGGTVTVDISGDFYGYEQYWGTIETGKYIYHIKHTGQGAGADSWGGTVENNYSFTSSKRFDYQENIPELISFQGGYVQAEYNRSVLEYRTLLPEFDSAGYSTDNMIEKKGTMAVETFPVQKRLPVPSLNHLRGHWAENDIKRLYSLGVFQGGEETFNPEQVITRAEFTEAIVRAAKAVPVDPDLQERGASRVASRKKEEDAVSPFRDVPTDHAIFKSISEAYERGLVNGISNGLFAPDNTLTMAEALTILIRALGLENMGPGQNAVTVFRDNDDIPYYARNAAYVAYRIGLVQGDTTGRLNPNQSLTKSRAAALLNRFIDYMREDMARDYREKVLLYSLLW